MLGLQDSSVPGTMQVTDKGATDVIDEVEAAVCGAVLTIMDGAHACQARATPPALCLT